MNVYVSYLYNFFTMTFMNSKFDENLKSVQDLSADFKKMKAESGTVQNNIAEMRKEIEDLKAKQIDLQARSMRDNLVFNGIEEASDENTEHVLNDFLKEKMKLDELPVFHRVHRLGKKVYGRGRPIIAKFANYKEREKVRKGAAILKM